MGLWAIISDELTPVQFPRYSDKQRSCEQSYEKGDASGG
jgi:hypothetical protein